MSFWEVKYERDDFGDESIGVYVRGEEVYRCVVVDDGEAEAATLREAIAKIVNEAQQRAVDAIALVAKKLLGGES